ncbi:MAG TPA: DNA ligase, partial [Planctomycetota bacterium]|nr:DNA ligase [Planctomycetota bacterium]
HLFEIKWDGIRALTFVEGGELRALSRNRQALTPAFPELAPLLRLPSGTLLDGELVVLEGGRPSFSRSLERMQAKAKLRVDALARSSPAQYVVFDLLYLAGDALITRPLHERRARLQELLGGLAEARIVFSDGVIGPGRAFFEEARTRGLEGIVAKERDGAYLPGKRTRSWIKVKTTRTVPCAILGWVPDERGELTSLIVALEEDGRLVSVGRVGSGLTEALRARLLELCRARATDEPFVACTEEGRWVEPGLYCSVSFLERTRNGLRAPVFVELLEEG